MRIRSILSLAAAAATVVALGACGSDNSGSTSTSSGTAAGTSAATTGGGGGASGKIALLLPESKTARYESQDRPLFEAKMKQLCPNCEIVYSNADQDASKQQSQAEAAITEGVKVMVLDPVDSASAAAIVNRAKQSKIPVVSYDRLITGAPVDYYISFDNVKVGKLQGDALVKKLKQDGNAKGPIIKINGAPTDNNAKLFKQGSNDVFSQAGVDISKQYDTPDWSPDKAQSEMEQAITAVGKDKIKGVYAANDGTAGGAIAAMKSAGMDPTKIPTTGQDAELAAIQRILAGQQYMTVYKAIKPEAETAAQLAFDLLQGKQPSGDVVNGQTDNGSGQVPSVLLQPVAVTKDNVTDTVVKDGFWTADQICTGAYKQACAAAGIS
ncbi:sugar ABC transporter substrate-binding protein [Capillimicrobium parvum]|uniref:D-xylose-binding periplasmic protein n=1 Tax=Capillimicrobium parvum TaxID=2884022 RepID=A0A9E6XZZ6_9ACTN|nr:sugar ABC transporter substrate-binding protein [Capillimicrobium parvum]UGS37637.1 D-xylose-binding periplasmic protein [Capillimicrobium parvum]